MLSTIALVLIILWLLGVVTSYTIGGFIHILLVVAIIMILIRLIRGEKVLYTLSQGRSAMARDRVERFFSRKILLTESVIDAS